MDQPISTELTRRLERGSRRLKLLGVGTLVGIAAVILASSLLLTGCLSGVTLQHTQTRIKVQCGPYPPNPLGLAQQERCISDYQRQGYERVPE